MATNRDRRRWAMVARVEYAKATRNELVENEALGSFCVVFGETAGI